MIRSDNVFDPGRHLVRIRQKSRKSIVLQDLQHLRHQVFRFFSISIFQFFDDFIRTHLAEIDDVLDIMNFRIKECFIGCIFCPFQKGIFHRECAMIGESFFL